MGSRPVTASHDFPAWIEFEGWEERLLVRLEKIGWENSLKRIESLLNTEDDERLCQVHLVLAAIYGNGNVFQYRVRDTGLQSALAAAVGADAGTDRTSAPHSRALCLYTCALVTAANEPWPRKKSQQLSAMRKSVQSSAQIVRVAAIDALGLLGDYQSVNALESAATMKDEVTVQAAQRAITNILEEIARNLGAENARLPPVKLAPHLRKMLHLKNGAERQLADKISLIAPNVFRAQSRNKRDKRRNAMAQKGNESKVEDKSAKIGRKKRVVNPEDEDDQGGLAPRDDKLNCKKLQGFETIQAATTEQAHAEGLPRLERKIEQSPCNGAAEEAAAQAELERIEAEAAERDRLLATLAAPGWKSKQVQNSAPPGRRDRFGYLPVMIFASLLLAIFCYSAMGFLRRWDALMTRLDWEPAHVEATLESHWIKQRVIREKGADMKVRELWIRARYPAENDRGRQTEDILVGDAHSAPHLPPPGSRIMVTYFAQDPGFPAKLYPRDIRPGFFEFAPPVFILASFHIFFALGILGIVVYFPKPLNRRNKALLVFGAYVALWTIAFMWSLYSESGAKGAT